jgi:hypothetical protein
VSAARKEQPKGSKRIKLDSRIAGRYWLLSSGCCWLIFDCSLVRYLYFAFSLSFFPFKWFSKYCASVPSFFLFRWPFNLYQRKKMF